jgi:hypothetical protein
MRIAELVDSLDLPRTEVAERAWEQGRRRVRRRRGALAAGAAAVAVACIAGVIVVSGPDHATTPSPAPSPSRTDEPRTASLVQPLLTHGRLQQELVNMDFQRFGGHLDQAVPLSSDPVRRAAIAMGYYADDATALVLGEDGEWRRVDVPGLVPVHDQSGYTSPIVRPTSLSPDATELALPQPNGLVVVDLTDGTSRRYDVPGPGNTYAVWADASHVLVAQEQDVHGTMVDLDDGSLARSTYGPSTRFLGDTTLTWGWDRQPLYSSLHWGDGRNVRTRADNSGGLFPQPPLVNGDVVIGLGGVAASQDPQLNLTTGFEVVDGSTGKLLAYLPLPGRVKGTTALLLGWDGDRPIIGAPLPPQMGFVFVFAWDWRRGVVEPIGVVGPWTSWGTGDVTE